MACILFAWELHWYVCAFFSVKDKYGDVSDDDTGSSSSETEDEEAEVIIINIS